MVINALFLGFSLGVYCLAYCVPIIGPLFLSKENASFKANVKTLGFFLLGRFLAYCMFGLVIGIVGSYTKHIAFFQYRIVGFFFTVLGLCMVFYGIIPLFSHKKLCVVSEKLLQKEQSMFFIGFLAGINICPPFLLAITYALSIGTVVNSIVFFFFFFLATTVYILPFIFSGFLSRFKDIRVAARITSIIAGIWFAYLGIERLFA